VVAATGTTIGGKTLAGFSGIPSLNDNGDVAFWSFFDDDSQAIILASAASPVPEPGTWMLMGTGLVGLLGYGWRKRQLTA
jgi:hypothetical protein